jgi:5'-3' exonuclease
MLTLAAHMPEIFLFREDQYNTGFYHLLDMGYVRHYLPQVMGVSHLDPDTAIDDFVLLGFFVGNDFLPKIQMFMYLEEGLELMLYNYAVLASKQPSPYLTSNGQINRPFFIIFVNELSTREYEYIISQYFVPTPDPKFINKTLRECVTEKNGEYFLNMPKYREMYYKKSDIDIHKDQQRLGQMCFDYIKTLYWIFQYYIHGLPSWEYYYPWHYPPLMVDIVHIMKQVPTKDLTTFDIGSPSLPFVQLLSVLPPTNSHLLPEKLRVLFKDKKLKQYYPSTFKVDYEGKTKEHMGITLLPFADVKTIRKEYEKVKIPKYARNTFTQPELFYYNPNRTSIHYSSYGQITKNHVFKMTVKN